MPREATHLRMCFPLTTTASTHSTTDSLKQWSTAGSPSQHDRTQRFTLVMNVAAQATTVEVTSAASQINTENGVIGDSKGTGDIGQLPLNFRASTTSPLAALATSSNVQEDSQGNVAIGGATSNMIGFSVDGISTTNVFNSAAGANPCIPLPGKGSRN